MNELVQRKLNEVESMLLSGKDVKREFEKNYIETLIRLNPELPLRYLMDFIHKAQLTGANPALNQIHLTTYYSKKLGHKVGVPVFSYHFFLNVANQTGEYEGVKVFSQVEDVFNPLTNKATPMLVSTATVRRKNKGEVTFKARWAECSDMKNPMWQTKPYIMLEKTAIANALRWAFPEALSGMYISEEIAGEKAATQADDDFIETTKVQKTEEKPKQSLIEKSAATQNQLKLIQDKCAELTIDMAADSKAKFINEALGVNNWSELKTMKLDQLMDKFDQLVKYENKLKEEPIKKSQPSFVLND